ncbi:MAG: DUF3822 family protein [Crocinitomicaceae bacterium]
MSYTKDDAFRHVLSMDLHTDAFRYAILDPAAKKVIKSGHHEIPSFSKDKIQPFLDDPIFQYEFQNYSLAAGGSRNTLIPTDLFSHTAPKDVFKLNYPLPHDNLDYNRIPELGIVNIYELPLWIKSLFVIKFPRVKITHRSTVLLKGIFDQPVFSPKIHLLVENDQFYYIITNRSKLIYYNRFDYKELSDIVYYLLFVLEQKELELKDFEIKVYGQSTTWDQKSAFEDLIKTTITLSPLVEKGELFLLSKQLLCV